MQMRSSYTEESVDVESVEATPEWDVRHYDEAFLSKWSEQHESIVEAYITYVGM